MIRRRAGFATLLLGLFLLHPAAARAQAPAALLQEGVSAYNDLEFGLASRILRRAAESDAEPPLTAGERERALMYLGATEVLRNQRNEAVQIFRDLVLHNPRYRPDRLVFPPRVTRVYDEALRTTKAVVVEVPAEQVLVAGSSRWRIRLWVSSGHHVTVRIRDQSGRSIRRLYNGQLADSVVLTWNGLAASGSAPSAGRYVLEATSMVTADTPIRSVRVPLRFRDAPLRTLSTPVPPPDSLLLPEKRSVTPGLAFLIPATVIGAALILPALGSDSENREVRIAVGGAVTIAGLVGFILQKPGKPIPENIAYNDSVRTDYTRRLQQVQTENVRREDLSRFLVTAGAPQRVEGR